MATQKATAPKFSRNATFAEPRWNHRTERLKEPSELDSSVSVLGRKLWGVIRQQPNLGFEYRSATFAKREPLDERERAILWDWQAHIENSIPMLLAQSPADALAQLVVAFSLVTRIVDGYPDPELGVVADESEHSAALRRHEHLAVKRDARNLERCLYSIRRYLEISAGVNADEFGARFYMSRDDDPFRIAKDIQSRIA
jgi:hypothetical protein